MGFDLVNTIPITIGTLPLRAVLQSWPSGPPASAPEGIYLVFDRIKLFWYLNYQKDVSLITENIFLFVAKY